mmetsp:Transcript_55075/g.171066  ORF Transcript_55075/g.171066 Transcript_55075/m.171066 type:complete len:141 (+) Transcript_55075:487-909(+)
MELQPPLETRGNRGADWVPQGLASSGLACGGETERSPGAAGEALPTGARELHLCPVPRGESTVEQAAVDGTATDMGRLRRLPRCGCGLPARPLAAGCSQPGGGAEARPPGTPRPRCACAEAIAAACGALCQIEVACVGIC